jgi:hypothetical protein
MRSSIAAGPPRPVRAPRRRPGEVRPVGSRHAGVGEQRAEVGLRRRDGGSPADTAAALAARSSRRDATCAPAQSGERGPGAGEVVAVGRGRRERRQAVASGVEVAPGRPDGRFRRRAADATRHAPPRGPAHGGGGVLAGLALGVQVGEGALERGRLRRPGQLAVQCGQTGGERVGLRPRAGQRPVEIAQRGGALLQRRRRLVGLARGA